MPLASALAPKTLYGMFFSLPTERFEPASAPEVRFMETGFAQGASQPVLTTQAHTTATATASK